MHKDALTDCNAEGASLSTRLPEEAAVRWKRLIFKERMEKPVKWGSTIIHFVD